MHFNWNMEPNSVNTAIFQQDFMIKVDSGWVSLINTV